MCDRRKNKSNVNKLCSYTQQTYTHLTMTTKNLFSLSLTDRINYVKDIVTDIEQGTRLHNQNNFITVNLEKNITGVTNCGTAFCIAGWIFNDCFQDNLDYQKEMSKKLNHYKHITNSRKEFKNEIYPWSLDGLQSSVVKMVEDYLSLYSTETQQSIYRACIEEEYTVIWAFACAFLELDNYDAEELFDPALELEDIKYSLDLILEDI